MSESYHFTESGLDYVWLASGYTLRDTKLGRTIRFEDVPGLQAAIGAALVTSRRHLRGQDIRFLRVELGLSQATLAVQLGVTERTVIRWENDQVPVPRATDALLRALYLERDGRPHAGEALRWVAELQEPEPFKLVLERVDGEWLQAA